MEIRLSSLTVNGICDLIDRIESINPNQAPQYKQVIKENNVNGRVLLHCDLQELKKVKFASNNNIDYRVSCSPVVNHFLFTGS